MQFPSESYLKRIGLPSPPPTNLDGLRSLHHAQFFSIPFENLDILLGRQIYLEKEPLYEKLINSPRGGYCFELNGLLLYALKHFGFTARPLLARVHLETPPSGRTHQISLVTIEGHKWIVDAGFGGGGPRAPFLLEHNWELRSANNKDWGFRIQKDDTWGYFLQSLERGIWKNSYSFDLSRIIDSDILVGNHFTSTSPKSHFTQLKVVSLPTPMGRISLREMEFTEVSNGASETQTLSSNEDYLNILHLRFGIKLDNSFEEFRPLRVCHS